MYDDLLLPVAPGVDHDPAVDHARELAAAFDATVHVVAAADTESTGFLGTERGPLGGTGEAAGDVEGDGITAAIEEACDERVETVMADLRDAGVDVEGEVTRGRPDEVVIEAAERRAVDAVVMATHNREGVNRLLLGSVTERTLRRSSVPVIAVPFETADNG